MVVLIVVNVGVGLLCISGFVVDGFDVGSVNGFVLLVFFEEVVGMVVVDVSIGIGGYGCNGGNSNRIFYCKLIFFESDKFVVFFVVFFEW